ncbi:MAG: class I SAM-dependent methyltransferase [Gammaproteobacteria bacterium]|nr:class I SAM-dependent methyltransferase [Gammaproteobacteria bacterium]
MALKHSYTLLAPVYDMLVSGPIDPYRKKSIRRLTSTAGKKILVNGIGSGLDIPYLPVDAIYTGTDITPAMLTRAEERAKKYPLTINFQVADSQALPFEDDLFDFVIMHLILAVVPDSARALQEATRVLKPGGRIYIFDKFIRPGQLAIVRRTLSIFLRHIATRTDVVFEKVLKTCPELSIEHDEPSLANGWFRLIELHKQS